MRVAALGLGLFFIASSAWAAELSPYQRCEEWRARQTPITTKDKDGQAAAQKCTRENAGAVFYVRAKSEEGEKGKKGPVYVEVSVNRCEHALANANPQLCSVVWRNAQGNVETLTISVDGDSGRVMERGVGWKDKESSFSDVVRQMERDQLNQTVADWSKNKDASLYTPAALDQIAGAFDVRAAESLAQIPSGVVGQGVPLTERLQQLSGSLTPYAGAAQQAQVNMLAAGEVRSLGNEAIMMQYSSEDPPPQPPYAQSGYAPVSATTFKSASAETATGEGWWSNAWSTAGQWASSAWNFAGDVASDPGNFNCIVRKWANSPKPGDSC